MIAADTGPDPSRCALVVICDRSEAFGHALAHRAAYELAARDYDTRLVDLGDDGLTDVAGMVTPTTRSVVVIHPDWRDRPPARAVDLLDRMLVDGTVGGPAPRDVLVLVTSQERAPSVTASGAGPLEEVWRRCAADPDVRLDRYVMGPVAASSPAQRADWLARVDGLLSRE